MAGIRFVSSGTAIGSQHASLLEKMLEKSGIDSANVFVACEPLTGFSIKRDYSFATQAGSRKLSYHLQDLGQDAPVLIAIDDSAKHIQQKLTGPALDHLLQRINFKSAAYVPSPIQRLRKQLAHTDRIRLSRVEDVIYHLQVHNNKNLDGTPNQFGFPGAWMLHYNQNIGFYVRKIEPIPILEQCFACPYGLFENWASITGNAMDAEKNIAESLRISELSNAREAPLLCPKQWVPDTLMPLYAEERPVPCPLFFRGPPKYGGEVYRDRFASIMVPMAGLRFEQQEIPYGTEVSNPFSVIVPRGRLRMQKNDKLFIGKPFWIY